VSEDDENPSLRAEKPRLEGIHVLNRKINCKLCAKATAAKGRPDTAVF
jgi:hypothetical protein